MGSPEPLHTTRRKPVVSGDPARLRRHAETILSQRQEVRKTGEGEDPRHLLHELQVHQIELEMQNAELQKSRDALEAALETYTDLYDFAPVGYFSLDESGEILGANLTGAALMDIERSLLIGRRFPFLVAPGSRQTFLAFLKAVFSEPSNHACEALVMKQGGDKFWGGFRGRAAVCRSGTRPWCRVALGDVTERKRAEEAAHRLEVLARANLELHEEIARRQLSERALQERADLEGRLHKQSRHMQLQHRRLSHQLLYAQEEERKRISRELHDVIGQTLVGINLQLATLAREKAGRSRILHRAIARTQRSVVGAVEIVQRFARDLRPTVLDDIGLIPALRGLMDGFAKTTKIRARLTASEAVERLEIHKSAVLFRVAQEALTNVARHARASRVELNIQTSRNHVCMRIENDGKSFDVERVLVAKGRKRLGLLGMKERLEMVGGCLLIESAARKGTVVQARIPFGKVLKRE